MWKLYDRLIEGIPEGIPVTGFVSGDIWTIVRTEQNAGVAMTVDGETRKPMMEEKTVGMDLRKLAECVKSWNLREASLGAAAINAYYNREPEILAGSRFADGGSGSDAFDLYGESMRGKKVAVIGHFPFLERQLQNICSLSILERNPQEGDFPDTACEFLLPEQDFILITGSSLVNKTLPRLLELAGPSCRVLLVGPTVPLSPVMYDAGADALSGFLVKDADLAEKLVREESCRGIFKAGRMVNLEPEAEQ